MGICLWFLVMGYATWGTAPSHAFVQPIDGLSVAIPAHTTQISVRGRMANHWLPWQIISIDNEQDPTSRESELLMFPGPVTEVQTMPVVSIDAVHPIRVRAANQAALVAAQSVSGRHILSRSEWGADDSLLYRAVSVTSSSSSSSSSESAPTNDDTIDATSAAQRQRISDCEQAQRDYANEFQTSPTVTRSLNGQDLKWPHSYSLAVKMLVVHHTAAAVLPTSRPANERMQAMYQYHAKNRGWGDIGYHYIVDEQGQIYQGKAGGDYVVGGHAYCNNIGTVGIALMGEFNQQKPTNEQTESLQWLLDLLATRYRINTSKNITFHGKTQSPIIGHRDVISTSCPGQTLYDALPQIRTHVASGNWQARVNYPEPTVALSSASSVRTTVRSSASSTGRAGIANLSEGFAAVGSTQIEARPGSEVLIPVLYRAGAKAIPRASQLGGTVVADASLGIEQEVNGKYVRARRLITPTALAPNATVLLRVRIKVPLERRAWTIGIGPVRYTLSAQGRVARGREVITPYSDGDIVAALAPTITRASSSRSSSVSSIRLSSSSSAIAESANIRIALRALQGGSEVQVFGTTSLAVGGTNFPATAQLRSFTNNCELVSNSGEHIQASIVRFSVPNNGVITLQQSGKTYRYRGTIECRIINNTRVLINELPLEEYLHGLSEEPDTEPFEKQRAFAIAARTYAAWYMTSANRKFPGQPYDGSDSPAEFQKYTGVEFEDRNPRWLKAVDSTANQVLTYQGQLIKAAYFSASDGRTRSPAEVGWNSYPAAVVFRTKPDPWCEGKSLSGHGVGMSGCGAEGQANDGKTAEQILQYYYSGTALESRK
jgi:N-acetylmuramoyl-L-alanine amidase/Stage II sporulation protein